MKPLHTCPACDGADERRLRNGIVVRCALCGATGKVTDAILRGWRAEDHRSARILIARVDAQDEWAAAEAERAVAAR